MVLIVMLHAHKMSNRICDVASNEYFCKFTEQAHSECPREIVCCTSVNSCHRIKPAESSDFQSSVIFCVIFVF